MKSPTRPNPRLVAGIMSGTSADGVDTALCRIVPGPRLKLLHHVHHPYPQAVRRAVLAAMDAPEISVADLSRLNWRLGAFYAECCAALPTRPELIGLHGQTLYHQPLAQAFLGAPTRATWQTGEPAVLAERLGVPVVSDFRPADLAAGGQGAPLVPMLDYTFFRHRTHNRVLLNLGGIANLSAIPAAGSDDAVLAFDTGPANMVVDALMQQLFRRPFDAGGQVASSGRVLPELLARLLAHPYFAAPPPKSCGREQFGTAFVAHLRTLAPRARRADLVATATELTVRTVYNSYTQFCWPHLGQRAPLARATDLIVSGGGTENGFLLNRLRGLFSPLGVGVSVTDGHGLPSQSKEAAAFALLAWLTWHRLPGNLASATGAAHPAVLGKVTWA